MLANVAALNFLKEFRTMSFLYQSEAFGKFELLGNESMSRPKLILYTDSVRRFFLD